MIVNFTTMAVTGLLSFSWGLAFDIGTLLRFSKSRRCLSVPDCLYADRAELAVVIDGLTILIYGLSVNGCLTTDGIPLTAADILHDLVVATGHGKAGGIVKYGTG